MENSRFEDLNLSNDSLKAIQRMGFEIATPIQAQAIPVAMKGDDVIGLASTGTGKTAAFGLPAIEKIDVDSKRIQTLVLCPTRELAMQVAAEMNKFLKFKRNVSALAVYGGQDIRRQIYGLRRGPQIIIGTPGRVMDHLQRGTINFRNVSMVVLDEADEMLNMGFRQDIESILRDVKKGHQTMLFSATMSSGILQITRRFLQDPKMIKVVPKKIDTDAIEQAYFGVEAPYKIDMLMDCLNKYNVRRAIVFCNTKRKVDKVSKSLGSTGFKAAGIHGDIRQPKRDSIMKRFRVGKIEILVATDVAARGIDVSDVEIIFNFEIPRETESYVHRIGRTGRAGKKGKAFSFVSRMEFRQFKNIMRFIKQDIKKADLKISAQIDKKQVNKNDFVKPQSEKRRDVKKMSTRHSTASLKISSELSSAIKSVDDQKPVKDNYFQDRLEKKAVKVLKKLKVNIESTEHSTYLNITKDFVSKKFSPQDLSAVLLRMLVDSKNNKGSVGRFR